MDSRLGCNTPGEDEHMFYKEREKLSYLYSEMHEKLDLKHRRLFLLMHLALSKFNNNPTTFCKKESDDSEGNRDYRVAAIYH